MPKPHMNETGRDLMLRCMISMAAADGTVADVESATISAIFEKVTGETVESLEIESAASGIVTDANALKADLAAACGEMETSVKEAMVRAAYLVLLADGEVAAPERKKLIDIAKALKIPEIHLNVILEGLES